MHQLSGTGCIIVSPTRELSLQTYEVLKKLLVDIPLSHSLIVGGEKKNKEVTKLCKGNLPIVYVTLKQLMKFKTYRGEL